MTIKVIEVQKILLAQGYDIGNEGADGKAGKAYERAVRRFQIAKGLAPDGKVGPNTEAALRPPSPLVRADVMGLPIPAPEKPVLPKDGLQDQWPFQKDCMKFYGGVGLHQTTLRLPFKMKLAWDLKTEVERISVHEKVHQSAARAFDKIASAYDEAARKKLGLDLFGGSLNVRVMRGGSAYSMHSWGIAIDFDPARNQLKWGRDKARLAKPDAEEFWKIWESEGWVSLGRAANRDWMHVQAARL